MILYTIIGLALGALALGFGVGLGMRLLRLGRDARRALNSSVSRADPRQATGTRKAPQSKEADFSFTSYSSRPRGARRTTSIHGITGTGLLRHTDGSYTKAYRVEMENTLYADGLAVDRQRNAVGEMLASIRVPNVVVQFRYAVHPDKGEALHRNLKARCHDKHSYMPARMLNAIALAYTDEMAREASYQRGTLTMWVRVPARHANDSSRARASALVAFLPALVKEIRLRGLLNWTAAVARAWTRTNRDRLTRRTAADEQEAMGSAMQVFAGLEHMCPLRITPFGREELWEAVYLGHRRNEHAAPRLSEVEGADLREHLCGEDIRGDGEFLLHGRSPVAIVSLFRPPTPVVTADMMRFLTNNANLVCEHTDVVEFITLDQERAKTDLKHQYQDLSRAEAATTRRSSDPEADDPDSHAARGDIKGLRKEMSGGRSTLISARAFTVVAGDAARNRGELRASLDRLDAACRQVTSAYGKMPGANLGREHPEGLRALYPNAIAGELSAELTGRECKEIAGSLARLAPLEAPSVGSRRPHTIVSTPSRHLTGIDLYDRTEIISPVGVLIAGTGGGKSVLLMKMLVGMLDTIPKLRAKVCDYGGSCEPLVKAMRGRHIFFSPGQKRTINVWDYEGLQERLAPTELQLSYVVQDALILAGLAREDRDYKFAKSILFKGARQVYANELPRNRPGRPKHEPRLAHLVDWLRTNREDDAEADACSTRLRIALEAFVGDPFIDAPTHPDFAQDSRLDVYELKSLEGFSELAQESLALRIVARVIQSEGKREPDGTRTKMVLVFDELWQILAKYPVITDIINRYARTGRKEGVFTLLATQAFEDVAGTPLAPNKIGHALLSNVGVKFIGLQNSKFDDMAHKFDLTPATVSAIDDIRNSPGEFSQFVGIWGSGTRQRVEKFQLELTPLELWSFTSDEVERNARTRVEYLCPEWTQMQVHMWLAEYYPQGLVNKGLTEIDEDLLRATRHRIAA